METRYSIRAIADLVAGDHWCCLYETEEEHRALLTPCLRLGLERHEQVLYIVDAHTVDTVLGYLREDGVDVEPYLSSGQLQVMTAEDAYVQDGRFDPDRMISFLRTTTECALAEGYTALRVTGEMTWVLKGRPGSDRLIEYEAKLNTFFPGSSCLAICQYDRRLFDPALLVEVVATHPFVVVGTNVYDNFFYIPPADFLGRDRPAATLRHWLDSLEVQRQLEEDSRQKTVLLQLLRDVAVAANQAASVEAAVQFTLDRVCAFVGWPIGHAYMQAKDAGDQLESSNLWHLDDLQEFAKFREVTQGSRFALGVGLPGRVRLSGKPAWIVDAAKDPNFPRAKMAENIGIKAAFAFPVQAGSEVVAVLEFFSPKAVEPNEALLEVMDHIGVQLGQVVERKRANDKLRESQAQLMEAQQLAHLGSWDWNITTNEVSWSDELYHIFGLKLSEFDTSYEGFLERVHPDDRDMVIKTIEKAYAERTHFSFQHRIVRPDGAIRILQAHGKVVTNAQSHPVKMVGTSQDITERVQAERALHESRAMFESLFEAAPDANVLTDDEGRIVRLNRQAELLLGYDREELLGKPVEVLLPARFRKQHVQHRSTYYITPRLRSIGAGPELYGLRKDGTEFPADITLSPLQIEDDTFVISVVRDITGHRQAEEALRQSEARFRAIFEKGAMGISLLDLEGHVLASNPAFQRMLGYSASQLRGVAFTEFTHPHDVDFNTHLFQELVAGKRDHYRLEKRYIRKDKEVVWGYLTVSLVRDAEGRPQFTIGMLEDITERKQMEAELAEVHRQLMESREAERLHVAQELHDGPMQDLYGVSYRLTKLWEVLPDETSAGEMVAAQATLQKALRSLRTISQDLRPPVLAPFGLEKAIRSHIEEFHKAHPELELQLDLMFDGQKLPEQMRLALFRIYQQALTNVIRHAEAHRVSIRFILDADHVVLEIKDDGCGFRMPKRPVALVRQGHLGLVGMAERAEAIGGRLEVVSAPGEGTLVRVVARRSSETATSGSEE